MNVLLFTDADVFAGTERHMLDLACGLRAGGIGVSVGCPVPGALAEKAGERGIAVHAIPKRGSLDWRAVRRLGKIVRQHQIDIVHAHNGRTAFITAVAKSLGCCARSVVTQHFINPCYVTRRGISAQVSRAVHHWVDHRTDHLIAISQATLHGSVERGEARPDGITVVRNGLGVPDPATLKSPAAVRAELGIEAESPMIVCAARLEPEKDVSSLVLAMASVLSQSKDAKCFIAGTGVLHQEIEDQINRLGIGNSVRLLGFRSDVLSVINASDLLVLPSHAEPFGLVLLEAMALSKPVIATAAGGPLEIVEHGRTGLLVVPHDIEDLAKAILKLLATPEARSQMGRAGKVRWQAKFTVERMINDTLVVYSKLLEPPSTVSSTRIVGDYAPSVE